MLPRTHRQLIHVSCDQVDIKKLNVNQWAIDDDLYFVALNFNTHSKC